ncbi:ComEC/Rec2 family competence protein [Aestuariivirga sp.]|uniref:ComEC/Rec2 family competence protein n=1 Tax=Aestuariivirga sp. TaxID=2650926 RepID=UPI0039E47E41
MEGARLTVWAPLLLAAGIWLYFSLTKEPGWLLAAGGVGAAAFLAWRARGHPAVLALCLVITGFLSAELRSHWVATPLVRAYSPGVHLVGRVADIDRRSAKRMTLVLEVEQATGLPLEETPLRVKILATGVLPQPRIGDRVEGEAILLPLPLPVEPGAFDYGRSLFFQSIGATGRFTTPFIITDETAPAGFQLWRTFHSIRAAISARVTAVIEGPLGSFADALITGERASIPKPMIESLQKSGLFHILSISGLHMAIVAGASFWLVRALLALSSRLALTRPIKKWAALAALAVATFYMLLAEGGAATERSFIMIAVMFFAMVVDRPAISLHNLAVAAIIILISTPEQATEASFQMSFMAVMGLAAFFEWWNGRRVDEYRETRSRMVRWAVSLRDLVISSLATSVIAGVLSGIPAAHHFGRLAPFSIVSNALALPLVSIAVMPMALLSVLLMPFGLEDIPLEIMGQGLRGVMFVSDWVAGWPHAGFSIPLIPVGASVTLSLAAALLAIPRSGARWLCLPLLVAGLVQGFTARPADMVVEERTVTIAALNADGLLVPLPESEGRYAVGRWLIARGDREGAAAAAKRPLWTCTPALCTAEVRGRQVALLKATAEPLKPCPKADALVAQYPLRRTCRGGLATIDRFDVWRHGAHAVTFTGEGAVVTTARGGQGDRLWTVVPRPRAKSGLRREAD